MALPQQRMLQKLHGIALLLVVVSSVADAAVCSVEAHTSSAAPILLSHAVQVQRSNVEETNALFDDSHIAESERINFWDWFWQGFESETDQAHSAADGQVQEGKPQTSTAKEGKAKPPPLHKRKMYVLLGPEDSGTNLLQALVERNWPNKYVNQDRLKVLWKHSNSGSKGIYSLFEPAYGEKMKQMPVFIVLRSPISQVSSWMSAPYELRSCVKRNVTSFGKPCKADLRARSSRLEQGALEPLNFTSVMEVYNQYIRQYQQLYKEDRFKSVTFFHYEDMIISPRKVVELLADALGEPVPKNFAYLGDETAKPNGPHPHGRSGALMKLHERSYLKKIGNEGLEVLCPLLDTSLVAHMVEGTYSDGRRGVPYAHDCHVHLK